MISQTKSKIIRLIKEGGWILIGQVAAIAGALVSVRILTEYLSPAQYGHFALGLSIAVMINQLIFGGVSNAIGRYFSIASENGDLNGYKNASLKLIIYSTVLVVILGIFFIIGLWVGDLKNWIDITVAALIFSIITGVVGSISGLQNAARQRAVVAFFSGLEAWLKIGLAILIMYWLGKSSTAVMIGYACALTLILALQIISLKKLVKISNINYKENNKWIKKMLEYSLPFSIWGVFTAAQQASDRWSLQKYGSTVDVGHYAVLFQVGYTPISIITTLAINFLGPILFQRSGDATDKGRNNDVERITWIFTLTSIVITTIAFTLAMALHEWIFSWLVAFQYQVVSNLLPWMVLAGGLYASGQMLALKFMSDLKSSALTAPKITTAIIGILLNIVGAVHAGINGVVYALCVSSALYFIWTVCLVRKIEKKNE